MRIQGDECVRDIEVSVPCEALHFKQLVKRKIRLLDALPTLHAPLLERAVATLRDSGYEEEKRAKKLRNGVLLYVVGGTSLVECSTRCGRVQPHWVGRDEKGVDR